MYFSIDFFKGQLFFLQKRWDSKALSNNVEKTNKFFIRYQDNKIYFLNLKSSPKKQ